MPHRPHLLRNVHMQRAAPCGPHSSSMLNDLALAMVANNEIEQVVSALRAMLSTPGIMERDVEACKAALSGINLSFEMENNPVKKLNDTLRTLDKVLGPSLDASMVERFAVENQDLKMESEALAAKSVALKVEITALKNKKDALQMQIAAVQIKTDLRSAVARCAALTATYEEIVDSRS